jgi:hypothetical protein
MKFLILTLLTTFSLAASASENIDSEIIGKWKFSEYIYQDKNLPLPNPNLNLIFEFNKTGSNRLFWYRENEDGFCERIGLYTYTNLELTDEVVWTHPDNHVECSKDPDMILGKKTKNKVTIANDKLYLHLALKGQPFIYVWEKQ